MWKLRLYLSQLLVTRWLVTTFGMVVLVGLLDSLANAGDIAASDGGGAFRYMFLRAPIIFDQVFLFTLMLALLLTFVSLIRRNELVAIQGLGLPLTAQIRIFAPVVLLIGVFAGAVIDWRVPSSVRALNVWEIGEYKGGNITEDDPLWLNDQSQGLFVSITGREGENTLTGLTFFQRDDQGRILGISWADTATFTGGGWALDGISHISTEEELTSPLNVWQTDQNPDLISRLAAEPRDLAIGDLRRLARLRGSGSRPSSAYSVWYFTRLTLPLAAFALLLVAVPMMQRLGRRDSGTASMIITLAMTFLFLIIDGIAKTLGAAGAISPLFGAVGISTGFGLIGAYLVLRQESLA